MISITEVEKFTPKIRCSAIQKQNHGSKEEGMLPMG